MSELKGTIQKARAESEPNRQNPIVVRCAVSRGPRHETDAKAMELAVSNAKQVATDSLMEKDRQATKTSLDGTAMHELATMLDLEKPPSRIECYDISHTQGEIPVGSRVVFINGKPAPELYRRFNIKAVKGIDDYASLEEVLHRRFSRVWENGTGGLVGQDDPWSMPDLVVIDGGVGQLGAAIKGMAKSNIFPRMPAFDMDGDIIVEEEVLDQRSVVTHNQMLSSPKKIVVPICSLAKSKEEVFVFGKKRPVNDGPDSAALLLLRSLRDESHRYALHSHRKRRSAQLMK
jgi:excinuclease ABC subunit C